MMETENAKKILLVEDDKGISEFLICELNHEGFTTVLAETGRQALEKFESENPDLILLDVMLPEMNGLEVLRRIRKISKVPVILETARGETIDKINGLNEGADDYIAKPFETEELLARINALFRRIDYVCSDKATGSISHRELELNAAKMTFCVKQNEIALSKTEFLMIKHFIENPQKVLSRNELIDAIWGKNHFIDENTIDVYVGYLRSKIAQFSTDEYIKTVRGTGYILI